MLTSGEMQRAGFSKFVIAMVRMKAARIYEEKPYGKEVVMNKWHPLVWVLMVVIHPVAFYLGATTNATVGELEREFFSMIRTPRGDRIA